MKEAFPPIRSVKSCVVGALALALPFLLLALPGQGLLGPLPALYAALLTLYLLPPALCTVEMVCGTLPMMIGLAAAFSVLYALMGTTGLLLAAVYVLPVLIAFFSVVSLRVPFRKSVFILMGVHAAALAVVFLICQRMAGGDLYTAAGDAAANFLKNWEAGDMMLYQLYSTGLISLTGENADSMLRQVLGGYQLSAAARADMLLSVRAVVSEGLKSLVPYTLVSRSVIGGVACLLLPLRFGFLAEEKRAFLRDDGPENGGNKIKFPDLDMPPFSLWHLPRGIGWQVGAALAAGYIFRVSAAPALATAGSILYAAASSVFTVQGAAALNFIQKARGARRSWRVIVPVLLLATQILMFIGIFDQISNFRGLRKPPEPKEDMDL